MKNRQSTIKVSLKSIAEKNLNDISEIMSCYGGEKVRFIQSKFGKNVTSLATILGVSGIITLVAPSQALGLAGLATAYASARMKSNTDNRTGWALACCLFAGQYATNIDDGFGGLITTTCAAARGFTLTHIQSSTKIKKPDQKNTIASVGFTAVSMVTVATTSLLSETYSNLILLPALISSGTSDYLPDNRSHLARHFRLATFGTLLAYDALIAKNYGGALASGIMIHQYIKTAKKEGDYQIDNEKHGLGSFFISLTKPKIH